jgi:hypothetical protein
LKKITSGTAAQRLFVEDLPDRASSVTSTPASQAQNTRLRGAIESRPCGPACAGPGCARDPVGLARIDDDDLGRLA